MSVGYGLDIWCIDSLSPGVFATGPMLVLQACYRRLITPRGTLQGGDDESAYGFDLSQFVGMVGTPTAIAALPGLVAAELKKDDRVSSVDCTATVSPEAGGGVTIVLAISVGLSEESGSFDLTLAVTDATTTILGLAA